MQQEQSNARYHLKCYRNYTAVKRPTDYHQCKSPKKKTKTRRTSSMPPSDAKGLLKGLCIFCSVVRKTVHRKVEPLSHCLTRDGYNSIAVAAARSSNERIKALIDSGVDLIAKQAQYHKSCRKEFFKEVEGTSSKNEQVSKNKMHAMTFEIVSDFIEKEIIGNRKAMLVTVILELYKSEFLSEGGKTEEIECYTGQALMKKK